MANIMMPQISKSMEPANAPDAKSQIEPNREASFSNYMDKKIRNEQREKRAMLGVKEKPAPRKEPQPVKTEHVDDTETTYLQQLMGELQKLLAEDDGKAGEWTFDLENSGVLNKLATSAGMSDTDLALMQSKMEEQGSLGLADLFVALEEQFSMLNQDLQVVVPETNVAFLESLLSKMGLSAEELSGLSDEGVNGLSELDLIAYLGALKQYEGADSGANNDSQSTTLSGANNDSQIITLSSWELEQLQSLLDQAGMSEESLITFMPEANSLIDKGLKALGMVTDEPDMQLSFDRLKSLLEQAISDADTAKVKANVPVFIEDLKTMLSQAGFDGKDVGWTPVVQGAMSAVYQELQKMVDLTKVRIEAINETLDIEKGLTKDWLDSAKSLNLTGATKADSNMADLMSNSTEQPVDGEVTTIASPNSEGKDINSFLSHLNTKSQEVVPVDQQTVVEPRTPITRVRLTPEMQQFSIDQISQGVMRGLRNSLQQLTLTLYPKELGEVKVDLQVRESHIAVSFVMESSRVKEALESNLQDFKDNLNKQGFSLQECFVSVDQNNSEDARQRFEEAWERLVSQNGYEKDIGQPNEVMAMVGERHINMHQGGTISLFV